ncbi:hypothetical protein U6A24_21490 [Aquimarina gracilis]|uniref:DUF4870 domain-containing protein n=1 Tax=Aquimarina gracilis TaxID=874422 RepID=A0ABU6A1S7_9FLAO|nr:hypothetical protein [Aquimarina gracilis]MEB3348064.1 hypothetical protein [Aquimarina gracilis]
MESDYAKQGKTAAIIAYITIFGTLIAFFMNHDRKNQFASFHIRQALGLWIMFYLLVALAEIFNSIFVHIGFWFFSIVLIIYGLILASREEQKTVPIVGPYFQEWFNFIK